MRITLIRAAMMATLYAPLASSHLLIANECASPVYLTLVCGRDSAAQTIPISASTRVPYPTAPGGERACSAKLNLDNNFTDVFQFEYSFDDNYRLWWDLSSLDGDPFLQYGRVVDTSGGDAGTRHCPRRVVCGPGDERCAYWEFREDGPNWWCDRETDVTLTLCETKGLVGYLADDNDDDWVGV